MEVPRHVTSPSACGQRAEIPESEKQNYAESTLRRRRIPHSPPAARIPSTADAGSGTTARRRIWRPSPPLTMLESKLFPPGVEPTINAVFEIVSAVRISNVVPIGGLYPF